ncbi:hypothetical protein BDM02DRAFT_3111416 [Thelephora ganbajun]|uniref:Uncharacterized protein n=1 Tax=Thelephora ganbajun TaxID=370292 RepID=A0ACB6ZM15_THEGA|nr:hypothetical protein BDM02DRAFT_3111416 [Thelephora ganbajun]
MHKKALVSAQSEMCPSLWEKLNSNESTINELTAHTQQQRKRTPGVCLITCGDGYAMNASVYCPTR